MFDPEVISFAHGDGLRAPDSAVVAAGIESLLDSVAFPLERYNFLERYEPLEASIRETMAAEGFPPEHITSLCIDSGTTKLFVSYLMALCRPDDVVLTAPTFYHGLIGWCDLLGLTLHVVPTAAANAYKLDYETLTAAHRRCVARTGRVPRTVVVFNPTQCGAIYTAEELEQIAAYCSVHGVEAVEDTIFARTRFDLDAPVPHLAAIPAVDGHVVSLDGCSKADGLANIRVGWALGPSPLIQTMEAIKAATTVGMPHIALVMADTALRAGIAPRRRDASACQQRSEAVIAAIGELNDALELDPGEGFKVRCPPAAGHSVLVDVPPLAERCRALRDIHTSVDLTAYWLDRAAVAVSPLYSSGLDGLECRLNFASLHHSVRELDRRSSPLIDIRPMLLDASLRRDQRSVTDLLARRQDPSERHDAEVTRLIREGIIERIGSALQPRCLVPVGAG